MELFFVGLYLALLLALGARAGRRESSAEFLIASRRVGTLGTSASMLAVTGGLVMMGTSALAFTMGIAAMWYWIGFAFGMIFLALVAGRIKSLADREQFLTIADFVFLRTDRKTATLSAAMLFVAMFFLLTGQLIAAGNLFSPLLDIPYPISVFLVGLVTIAYLFLGGYKAVVLTDMIQFGIMFLVLAAVVVSLEPGDFSSQQMDPWAFGGFSILLFLVLGAASTVTAAEFWQRIYAAKSRRVARNACFLTAGVFLTFALGLTLVGMTARSRSPEIDPDTALYHGLFELVSPTLGTAAIVMLLAAVMSTIDTELFYLASSLVKDFVHRNRSLENEDTVRLLRLAMVALTFTSMLTAIWIADILPVIFGIASLLTAISPLVILSLFRRVPPNAAFLSLVCGILALVVLVLSGHFDPDTSAVTFPAAVAGLAVGYLLPRSANSAPIGGGTDDDVL